MEPIRATSIETASHALQACHLKISWGKTIYRQIMRPNATSRGNVASGTSVAAGRNARQSVAPCRHRVSQTFVREMGRQKRYSVACLMDKASI